MLYTLIKNILIVIFFLSSIQLAFSDDLIKPLKKPNLSDEQNIIKISSNFVIPKEKPNNETKKEIIDEVDSKLAKNRIIKINGIIVPKNKPLIVKKDRARKKKSIYYSDRDLNYAKQAIKFMEKGNWKDARKVAKKSRAKTVYDFILWRHLLTTGNNVSFTEYKKFIERVKKYPRLDRIKYLAEHKISITNHSPNEIINWFEAHDPLSGFGKMILGECLLSKGKSNEGLKLIKNGFTTADLSKNDLKYFRKKYKKYLSTEDYINRADYLSWEGKYWDLKRMLRYLPKDYQLLYTARQILMTKGYGVDNAISKVPKKFKNDAGLNYDRLKWRRKKGRVDSSLEILLKIQNTSKYMIRPDKWWKERSIIAGL